MRRDLYLGAWAALACLSTASLACSDDGGGGGDEAQTETETDAGTDTESETGTDTDTESETDTGAAWEDFEVGFDVRDLSPTEAELAEEFYLGGYGFYTERGPCEGVHDPVFVRTMAIAAGEDAMILAIVDSVGMGNQWTRAMRGEIQEATGLSPEQIVIATTHTHSGPDFMGLWGSVPEAYRERVITAVVESAETAYTSRVPATLEVSSTITDNRNRRGWEFTDDSLVAVRASDPEDGSLLGVMFAFAAHPVVLGSDNKLVSRDYPGYAVDALEAELDVPVLLFNGILGDVSPKVPEGDYADDFERALAYGDLIAQAGLSLVEGGEVVSPELYRDYTEWDLVVENELLKQAALGGLLDMDYDYDGETASITTQSNYLRLGDSLQLVAFPGETLTRNGLAIKEFMTTPYTIVIGNAGEALGYFIPSDEWMTGLNDDYEESVSLGMMVGDQSRDAISVMITDDPGAP
ncbi:hypothetical protein PPSIR1_41739 [Plesiocystis pacifica SIR-1]|uniref:Neutral/alkaline non-lysosomal ceramidase N-terminal domain-containing protein n=1 Tax=Plesiocystis pacifica SIR-1 TaxID=391625 RepID=A6G0T9_9BACT|nr:hypothetical protein [Plesiocystis pacifica]EDM80477.1 hypothetical protein PPSIR1_41739 [Plesiocystis pacifica SIR-1]